MWKNFTNEDGREENKEIQKQNKCENFYWYWRKGKTLINKDKNKTNEEKVLFRKMGRKEENKEWIEKE